MSTQPRSPETRAEAIADYQTGMTLEQVAAKHGLSSSGVQRWLMVAGIPRRPAASVRQNRTCTIDGCDGVHRSRGYCTLHYKRIVKGVKPRGSWRPFDPADRIEDCRWMAETGEGLSGAARRIGISPEALDTWLRNNDPETLPVLQAQDVLPLVSSRATFHGAGLRVSA